MKTIIFILFSIICLGSCSNRSIESDPNKTTIEEIEKLKSDTITYKVIVDDKYNVKIYNKETNLRVYQISNYDGAVDSLCIMLAVFFFIILILLSMVSKL